MLCRKYEWDSYIDFHIKLNKIYQYGGETYTYFEKLLLTENNIKFNWKKSLEVC